MKTKSTSLEILIQRDHATYYDRPTQFQYHLDLDSSLRPLSTSLSVDSISSKGSYRTEPLTETWNTSQKLGKGFGDDSASTISLQLSASTRRLGPIGTLPTFFVLLISFGFGTLILGWVITHQDDDPESGGLGIAAAIRNGSFVLNEGKRSVGQIDQHVSLRVLMFSALASHLISVTSAFLMTIVAYRAAAQWLSSSETSTLDNPTPLQYGLLCRTLGSSNVMAFLKSLQYVMRGSGRRAALPRLFKEALGVATIIYFLTHAVGTADLWLHATTYSAATLRPEQSTSSALFGVDFNSTLCQNQSDGFPCLSSDVGWAPNNTDVIRTSYSTSFNESDSAFRVITLADERDMAIVIPGSVDYSKTTFVIDTFAARAQCESMNNRCMRSVKDTETYTSDCTNIGYPEIPWTQPGNFGISTFVLGFVNDSMAGLGEGIADFPDYDRFTPNPASLVLQLRWSLHLDATLLVNEGESAIDVYPKPWVALYANCSLEYYDVTVQYHPTTDSWSLVNSTLASPELASILWAPLIYQHATEQIIGSVIGIAMKKHAKDEVVAALNQNLGRHALSQAAGAFEPSAARQVHLMRTVVLGLYPATPLLALIGVLYLYSALALVLFVVSYTANYRAIVIPPEMTGKDEAHERSALDLVQTYLTDPVPILAESFPAWDGKDPQRSVARDPLDMIYDGGASRERLRIGLHAGYARFGLRRRTGREDLST